mgnify:CR=1 FL=1
MIKISEIISLKLISWNWPDSQPIVNNLFSLDKIHEYKIQLILKDTNYSITITILRTRKPTERVFERL